MTCCPASEVIAYKEKNGNSIQKPVGPCKIKFRLMSKYTRNYPNSPFYRESVLWDA